MVASFDHYKTIGFVQKEFPVRIPTPINTAKLMTQAGPSQASPTQLLNPSQVGTQSAQTAGPSSSKTAKTKPKSKSKTSTRSGTEQLLQMAQLLMAQAQMAQAQPEDEDTEEDDNSEGDSNESISNYQLS